MFIQLEVTTRCNFSCFYCAGRDMPQRDMAWDTFSRIVDAIPVGNVTVSLQGEGEPSLHPLFADMARYVASKGHRPYTILNGSRLDAERLPALFPRLGISIDSLGSEKAQAVGRHNLSKVLGNLQALCQVMSPSRITIMTVDMGQPLEALKAWVKQQGFGQHIIQPLLPNPGYSRRYTVNTEGLRRQKPSVCPYLEGGSMRFYTHEGKELPCCFMKDSSDFTSIPELRNKLLSGEPTRSCNGCLQLHAVKPSASPRQKNTVKRLQVTFSCQTRLVYEINTTQTARLWAAQIGKMRPEFLLRTDVNHRHGFATEPEIRTAVVRLKKCTELLGFPFEALSRTRWQEALNRLHVNFPEFFRGRVPREKILAAHEMNLLIHWLEYELANFYGQKNQYLFNLDFNHYPPAYKLKTAIVDDEFEHFTAHLRFGNLHLHYINIGRHFLEMADANDQACPPHHFKAQHEFNATCGLVFSEPVQAPVLEDKLIKYYESRGGRQFFGVDYQDAKLAKGFFRLGQLENLDACSQPAQRRALREQLKASQIIDWKLL